MACMEVDGVDTQASHRASNHSNSSGDAIADLIRASPLSRWCMAGYRSSLLPPVRTETSPYPLHDPQLIASTQPRLLHHPQIVKERFPPASAKSSRPCPHARHRHDEETSIAVGQLLRLLGRREKDTLDLAYMLAREQNGRGGRSYRRPLK